MTTAAERDRRIAAATKRIEKATTKAAALRTEADTHDAAAARAHAEIDWWKGAPVTDTPEPLASSADSSNESDQPENRKQTTPTGTETA